MFRVQAICPTRVDLAGGTLDLWPLYHQLQEKATINLGIDLYAKALIEAQESKEFQFKSTDQKILVSGSFEELCKCLKLPLLSLFLKNLWKPDLPPIKVTVSAKSPKGAGIGGSSALSVALCSAFMEARKTCGMSSSHEEEYIVNFCKDLESTLIKSPTGCQDYWGAIRGGLNIINYPYGKPKVETLSNEESRELCESLIIVFSGQSRDSAINNWSVFQNYFSGEHKTVESLNKIGSTAFQCAKKIKQKDIQAALKLSKQEWELRKELWPGIVTEKTESIDKIAVNSGAYFSRVCGAGGGGVMAIFAPQDTKNTVIKNLRNHGVEVLPAKPVNQGLNCTHLG